VPPEVIMSSCRITIFLPIELDLEDFFYLIRTRIAYIFIEEERVLLHASGKSALFSWSKQIMAGTTKCWSNWTWRIII